MDKDKILVKSSYAAQKLHMRTSFFVCFKERVGNLSSYKNIGRNPRFDRERNIEQTLGEIDEMEVSRR